MLLVVAGGPVASLAGGLAASPVWLADPLPPRLALPRSSSRSCRSCSACARWSPSASAASSTMAGGSSTSGATTRRADGGWPTSPSPRWRRIGGRGNGRPIWSSTRRAGRSPTSMASWRAGCATRGTSIASKRPRPDAGSSGRWPTSIVCRPRRGRSSNPRRPTSTPASSRIRIRARRHFAACAPGFLSRDALTMVEAAVRLAEGDAAGALAKVREARPVLDGASGSTREYPDRDPRRDRAARGRGRTAPSAPHSITMLSVSMAPSSSASRRPGQSTGAPSAAASPVASTTSPASPR